MRASRVARFLRQGERPRRSGSKGVRFSAPVETKPQLGLVYVQYLTTHAQCRDLVLANHRADLVAIVTLLKNVMVISEFFAEQT